MAYKNIDDQRAAQRRWYQDPANAERIRGHAARYRQRNYDYVNELKSTTPCADCGINYPYYVMTFDHLSDKFRNISKMVRDFSLEALKKEIAKCEIVCANCHAERTHSRRTNPSTPDGGHPTFTRD